MCRRLTRSLLTGETCLSLAGYNYVQLYCYFEKDLLTMIVILTYVR